MSGAARTAVLNERLLAHLEAVHGIRVRRMTELNPGVFRVDPPDGPSRVVRLFGESRPVDRVRGDAEILAGLAAIGFPAERAATPQPASVLDGRGVLVTEWVAGVPRDERRAAIRDAGGLAAVGELLARLSAPGPPGEASSRGGGAWHHLADGGPRAEIDAAAAMLEGVGHSIAPRERALYDSLVEAVRSLDDGEGLPVGFVHADPVLPNIVASRASGLVVVDWAGSGRAPRMSPLGFLLWSVAYAGDLGRVDRVVAGYRRRIRPEPEELARLAGVIRARPVVFAAWLFRRGRRSLAEAAGEAAGAGTLAATIAARARSAFGC